MKSDETGEENSKKSVLSKQYSDGYLKVNVDVEFKHNNSMTKHQVMFIRNGDNSSNNQAINDDTSPDSLSNNLINRCLKNRHENKALRIKTLNFEPDLTSTPNKSTLNQQQSAEQENDSNLSNVSQSISDSSLSKFSSNAKTLPESTPSCTPVKSSADEVDRAITKKSDKLEHILNSDQPLSDLIEHEYSSLSPSSETSSLLSTNSNCSKNSQLTDQLYNCDSESNPVVQVFIRVRPMNRFENNNQLIKKVVEINENNSTLDFKDRRNVNEVRYRFKFNHLFYSKYNKTLEDNQEEIFSKIGKPFVQNVLEGNDLCYFAYGQTGSGKSYTIMGDESTPGLVFRFAKQFFTIAELNNHDDLNELISKYITCEKNSNIDISDSSPMNRSRSTEQTLLAAKKQLYEVSQKYGFTDVIDCFTPENSFKKQENNSSSGKSKDKILRFDENIKCYKDDHIYQEKLFDSKDDLSGSESCKSFDSNEKSMQEQFDFDMENREDLNILNNILTRYGNQREQLKIEFSFKISFYEIYSENIYDLLESNDERIKSKVREHPTNGPYIVNLTMKKINSMKELNLYYELGNKRRSKGLTTSNDQSSRSHAIFTIYITQTHHYQPITTSSSPEKSSRKTEMHSKIIFVDLAGSERASSNDQMSDERLKEGNSINKSLLTLGKVISKLAWINKCIRKRNSEFDVAKNANNPFFYVPYRDSSKLTWLLKDCFNGKCKTFMIATIAPTSNHYDQTLSTLRYAHKASKIKVSFKFNQMIFSNQHHLDHKTKDSKRLYIEHINAYKDRSKENSQSIIVERSNTDLSIPEIPLEFNEFKFEPDSRLTNLPLYKSSLIEKIKEIFKEVI